MNFFKKYKLVLLTLCCFAAGIAIVANAAQRKIDFNTQVKPIFNRKCIACHGGVRQKGDFSLLFRSEALAPAKSGKPAIIPGNAAKSELIKRLKSSNPEERMPYKDAALSQAEIDILTQWINEGAEWGEHWAYVPVKPVPLPDIKEQNWCKNGIDSFVLQKLEANKFSHTAQADKQTLLRRASLDVIGMPAPEKLAGQFLRDSSENAYESLVDSLLDNPHYGEKWASMWLDLARYADTKGYEHDGDRIIWRYRDWLIRAFNGDKPYNTFLVEQLAGDLLPNPDESQLIATAFHRNSMTNDEGGTDPEEFRTASVIDRVNTTWEALMGTTFACAQCHSHPYDPFKHEDYYKFLAFFNDSRDENTEFDYPLLRHYNEQDSKQITELLDWLKQHADEQSAAEIRQFLYTWQPAFNSVLFDKFEHSALGDGRRVVMRNHAVCRLPQVDLSGKNHLIYRYDAFVKQSNLQIHLDSADGPLLLATPIDRGKPGLKFAEVDFPPVEGVHDLYFTYSSRPETKDIDEDCGLFEWFYFCKKFPGESKPGYAGMKKRYWELMQRTPPTTPVMQENPPGMHRKTHVFERGNWLVKGAEVAPDVPKSLNPFPANAPRNRLGLSTWMVSTENPLTARTMVNRVWEQVFGAGLAETLEDLGTQGIAPEHQDLLDWLSWRFMHTHHWSVKKLLKEILMSATYRQQSHVSDAMADADPYNRFFARGPRVRLSAEQIRDQTLAVSGLLSEKMYGPPVMPWQPKGIWLSPWNSSDWKKSSGEDQYRRAVYTFWKRTAAYPSMLSFDAVAREVCTARRIKTNTPLQALVTLNDSVYTEAAGYLARQLIRQNPDEPVPSLIKKAFARALQHEADATTEAALQQLFEVSMQHYQQNEAARKKILAGQKLGTEAAALTVVLNAIFNLDEFVTKT